MTLPAHASILTGLHAAPPRRHDNGVPARRARADARHELKRAGYRTGAFVGAFVLEARFGLNRGFDEYDDRLSPGGASDFECRRCAAREVV